MPDESAYTFSYLFLKIRFNIMFPFILGFSFVSKCNLM